MEYLQPAGDAPAPTRSAVIVPVPAADALVGPHRDRLDAAAAWGVPAHLTILYPFLDPTDIDDRAVARLADLAASIRPFDCRFERTGWFDDDVLWLSPDPPEPFRRLTSAVWEAFPDHPPYEGAHDQVVPHLTVAERRLCDLPTVRAVEQGVLPRLPLSTHVDRMLLVVGAQAPHSWRLLRSLPLGGARASPGGAA